MQESTEKLSPEELRELFKDPKYLPSAAEVVRAFPGKSEEDNHVRIWRNFLSENRIYQFLTQEMIKEVAVNLRDKINEMLLKNPDDTSPVIVLELGAGNGRLTGFLRREFKTQGINAAVEFIATDDMSWNESHINMSDPENFPVEQLSASEAVKKYGGSAKLILLSSWMPPGENWTKEFLDTPTVETMFLIGDVGATGTGDETWYPDGDYQTDSVSEDFTEGNFNSAMNGLRDSRNRSSFVFVSKLLD